MPRSRRVEDDNDNDKNEPSHIYVVHKSLL